MLVALGLAALGISSIAAAALLAIGVIGDAELSAFGVSATLTAPGLLAIGFTLGLGASLLVAGARRAVRVARERRRRLELMESATDVAGLQVRRRLLTDQIARLERKLEEVEQRVGSEPVAPPAVTAPRREKRRFPRMPNEPIVVLDDAGRVVSTRESEAAEI